MLSVVTRLVSTAAVRKKAPQTVVGSPGSGDEDQYQLHGPPSGVGQ